MSDEEKSTRTTLKLTPKQLIALIVLLLLANFLIGSLSGCVVPVTRPFPVTTMYEVDHKNSICGVYRIIDARHLRFDYVKDIPIEQCPNVFGFSGGDATLVLDWAQDALNEEEN